MPGPKKIRSFIVGEETVDVDASMVDEFLKAAPEAKEVQSYIIDGDTVDVDITQVNEFLKAAPNAKLAYEEPAFDDSAIPTVTLPEPPVLSPEDRQAIAEKLKTIPEKYLTDPNFQNTFISKYSKTRKVDPQAVRDLFDVPLLQQQVLDMQDQYAKSNDPGILYKLSNLHKRLGEDDKAAEAMSVADKATKGALPMVGGQDIVQPGNEMTYLGDDPNKLVPVGSDTKASEAMKGSADAISYMNFFTSAPTMIGHGVDKIARGFNTDVKKVSDIYSAAFDMAVGLGETAMGAMGATPHGGMFFAGFDAVSKLMPQKAAEWLSPASKLINEHYQEKGEEVPSWAENVGAVTDFALLAGAMGLGAKGINSFGKGIEKRAALKDFANWEQDVTPEMVESALKQVEQNQIQYADNPEQYRAFIVDRAKKMVDDAQSGKEVLDAEIKAVEPYEPQPAPESLRTVPEGSDVRMGDKMGKLERGDDGSWYFVDGETKKSTQISVEDKFNPTEKLADLGIEVLPDISSDAIAKAMADAEQVGTVNYNGKEYFVSLGNKMNEADVTGDIVAERSSTGLTTRFDQRDAKSEKFMKDRKLAIINQFLRSKGLPERTELFEPWTKKKEAPKIKVKETGTEELKIENKTKDVLDEVTDEKIGEKNYQDFSIDFEDGARAFGTIEDGVANISGINAPKSGGEVVRGTKTYERALSKLSEAGVKTVRIKLQSKDSSIAIDKLVEKGVLENPRNITGSSGNERATTFDIKSPETIPAEVVVEAPKIEVVEEAVPAEAKAEKTEKVEPIRQLGTGANVYFETEKHRVNDSGKNGGVLLNVGGKESEVPIANIEFTNAADAVKIAERINRDYPKGVPDAVLLDKYIDGLKKELLAEPPKAEIEPIKPKEDAIQKQSTNEGVLRQERPEVGLQEVEQGNAKPEKAPRETGEQPEPSEKQIESEVIPVKLFAKGEGGTKGVFIGEDGKLYKSLHPTIAKQGADGVFRREALPGETNEHKVLLKLQGNPNVVKVGKVVETSEGRAFEIEKLTDAGEITYEEYRTIENAVNEINAQGIEIGDKISVMRNADGKLVLNDFSTVTEGHPLEGYGAASDRGLLFDVRNKLSKENKNRAETEDFASHLRDMATSLLSKREDAGHTYLLTQRPPSIGTHPSGAVSVTEIKIGDRTVWKLTYENPLTSKEVSGFELTPILKEAEYVGKLITQDGEVKSYIKKVNQETGEVTTERVVGEEKIEKKYGAREFDRQVSIGDIKLIEPEIPVLSERRMAAEKKSKPSPEKKQAETKKPTDKVESKEEVSGKYVEKPLDEIKTDEARFQNRTELDQDQLTQIKENWNENELDPVVIWKDANGDSFILAGHHRLEAARQLGKPAIDARYFKGTEAEAIQYAKEKSNANRTMEQPYDRAKIYRKMREEGKSNTEVQKALAQEGRNKVYVENLSHLNPLGKTIDALKALGRAGDRQTQKVIEQVADWVGNARKNNKELTDAHENEIFDYLMNKGGLDKYKTKVEFNDLINRRINGIVEFDPSQPLNFEHKVGRGALETEALQELNALKREKAAAEAEIREVQKTETNKAIRDQKVSALTKKVIELNQKVGDLEKKQKAAAAADQDQLDIFSQLNEQITDGKVESKQANEFIESPRPVAEVRAAVESIESKAKSAKEAELVEAIKEADELIGKAKEAEPPVELPEVQDKGAVKKAADNLAAKIREGKINRPDMFLSSSPGAIAWDLALEAVAKTLEASGTVAQAVINGVAALRDTDWYKSLDKDKQKLAEEKFEEQYKEDLDAEKAEAKPVEEKAKPSTESETPAGPYGIKNEVTAAENVALGLPENIALTNAVKQEWKAVVEEAGRSKMDAIELANEVSSSMRPMSSLEQAVMLKKKVELMNRDNAIGKQIIEAYANEKPGYEDVVKTLLEERGGVRSNIQAINEAFAIGGREMGRAFNFRKALMDADYSLAGMEMKWTEAAKGKPMPESVRKKFEEYDTQLRELNEKYQKLEEEYNKKKLEEAFGDIQEATARKPKAPKKQALTTEEILRKKQLRNKFAGVFNDATNIAKALADKDFYEYARIVAKEALFDFKEFTKKLVAELGDGVEPYAQEIFEKVKPQKKKPVVAEKVLESGETVKEIKLNTDFLLDLIEKGADTGEKLANAVHEIISVDNPDITLREVEDAISGYGKTINPSKDPLRRQLSKLKIDIKLGSALEDARAGLGVKRSGFQRPKPTPDQRAMLREINEVLSEYPEDSSEVQRKWATALDRTKSTLRNAITDLEKRIDDIKNGVATEKVARRKAQLDQEALDLQAERDMLKKELTELEGKKGLTDEQKVKAAILGIERSMAEYKRRTEEINRTGTLTLKQKEKLDTPEIKDLKFYRDLEKQKYEQALKGNKIDEAIAINKALTNIENRIDNIEKRILNKDLSIKERVKKAYMDNPLIKAKQEQLKETNKILQEAREESGEAERHRNELYLKRLRERAAELQNRLDTGDFSKKVKPERVLTDEMIQMQAEIERIKYKVDVQVEKERLKNRTGLDRWKEQILDAINLPKSLLASMDLSAVLRQGAILSIRDPQLAAKAFAEMGRQMKSQEAVDKWTAALHSMPEYGMMRKTKLFLSEETVHLAAKEELFGSSYAKRIPGIGKMVSGSERAYTGYLNQLRVDSWLKYYEAAKNRGLQGAEMVKTMEAFSDFINNATGRANLGKLEKSASILNAAYFAPRYVASRFNLLNPLKYGKMPKQVRMEALRSMITYIGTGYGILQLAKAAGAEVNLTDPTSSDFGKIKIGDTRIDVFAGMQQVAVLMSRMIEDVHKVAQNQVAEEYDRQDTRIWETLSRFSRTKFSPVASLIYNTAEGENVVGEKTTFAEELNRMWAPLVYQDLYEIYQAEGADVLLYAAPMVFGVGVQNYVPKLPKLVEDGNVSAPAYKVMQQKGYVPRVSKLEKLKIDGANVDITNKQNHEYQVKVAEIAGEIINNATDKPYKIKGTDSEIPALKNMPPAIYSKVMAKILQYSRMEAKNQVFGKGKWAPADKYTEQEIEEMKEYRENFLDPRR